MNPTNTTNTFVDCSICLRGAENKTVLDACLQPHYFCYTCIKDWFRTQRGARAASLTCPVCRQPTSRISFNIRSADDYDSETVERPENNILLNLDNDGDLRGPFSREVAFIENIFSTISIDRIVPIINFTNSDDEDFDDQDNDTMNDDSDGHSVFSHIADNHSVSAEGEGNLSEDSSDWENGHQSYPEDSDDDSSDSNLSEDSSDCSD